MTIEPLGVRLDVCFQTKAAGRLVFNDENKRERYSREPSTQSRNALLLGRYIRHVNVQRLQRFQNRLHPPFDQPPGDASMVLQVDQSERRWNVHLPHGISAGSKRVAIAARA